MKYEKNQIEFLGTQDPDEMESLNENMMQGSSTLNLRKAKKRTSNLASHNPYSDRGSSLPYGRCEKLAPLATSPAGRSASVDRRSSSV
jgi:hypothetical protein